MKLIFLKFFILILVNFIKADEQTRLICSGSFENPWFCSLESSSVNPLCSFIYELKWTYNKETSQLTVDFWNKDKKSTAQVKYMAGLLYPNLKNDWYMESNQTLSNVFNWFDSNNSVQINQVNQSYFQLNQTIQVERLACARIGLNVYQTEEASNKTELMFRISSNDICIGICNLKEKFLSEAEIFFSNKTKFVRELVERSFSFSKLGEFVSDNLEALKEKTVDGLDWLKTKIKDVEFQKEPSTKDKVVQLVEENKNKLTDLISGHVLTKKLAEFFDKKEKSLEMLDNRLIAKEENTVVFLNETKSDRQKRSADGVLKELLITSTRQNDLLIELALNRSAELQKMQSVKVLEEPVEEVTKETQEVVQTQPVLEEEEIISSTTSTEVITTIEVETEVATTTTLESSTIEVIEETTLTTTEVSTSTTTTTTEETTTISIEASTTTTESTSTTTVELTTTEEVTTTTTTESTTITTTPLIEITSQPIEEEINTSTTTTEETTNTTAEEITTSTTEETTTTTTEEEVTESSSTTTEEITTTTTTTSTTTTESSTTTTTTSVSEEKVKLAENVTLLDNVKFEVTNYTALESSNSGDSKSYSLRLHIKGYQWNEKYKNVNSTEAREFLRSKILPLLYKHFNMTQDELNEVKLVRLFKGKP